MTAKPLRAVERERKREKVSKRRRSYDEEAASWNLFYFPEDYDETDLREPCLLPGHCGCTFIEASVGKSIWIKRERDSKA
jgi:hypothetical protein